jgi:SAM-dependent methyltransferase
MIAEPLMASCDFLAAAARWTCRDSGGEQCDWYHGTWQYLRLLNLVSNPGWHSDYLVETLRSQLGGQGRISALVCGCADYSAYAHVVAAQGERAAVTVLDWCATPLIATQWYARQIGMRQPRTVVADAVGFVELNSYDLIISDSFLPRFTDDELNRLLRSWRECLRDGGIALTTVRIHSRGGSAGEAKPARSQASAWREVAEQSRPWWAGVSALTPDELISRVECFAKKQERNAVYDADRLTELFARAGFGKVDLRTATINEKVFARVVAS